MNILLVEDHELFREGLKLLLADLAEQITFREAGNCPAALALAEQERFEVIVLDFHLPGLAGFEALQLLRERCEDAAIAVLSAEEDPQLIRRIIEAGAGGFIPKSSSHAVMMAALRLILAGGTYLPPGALHGSSETAGPAAISLDGLSERQLGTLKLAMQGKGNKVIARELNMSEATVKVHLSAAFRAIGARNRTEAVFIAARMGLRL